MIARAFNKILIDEKNQTIIKSSTHTKKLRDEINYYLNMPHDIKAFFPQLISYEKDYSAYTMELISSENLADQIVNNQITFDEGKIVINKVFNILDKLHAYKAQNNENLNINNFCIEKTFSRIKMLQSLPFFQKFLKTNFFYVNDEKFKNFFLLKNNFIHALEHTNSANITPTLIHGDFCFSNILYCSKTKKIKLIDPRGSFGVPGLYGNPLYDYAKLLHCLHGEYDYIINQSFNFVEKDNFKFYVNIQSSPLLKKIYLYFLQILRFRKINLDYLLVLEASLFLSMTSLHYENLERQKMLFLKGLIILNDVLKEESTVQKERKNAYMY